MLEVPMNQFSKCIDNINKYIIIQKRTSEKIKILVNTYTKLTMENNNLKNINAELKESLIALKINNNILEEKNNGRKALIKENMKTINELERKINQPQMLQ